MATFPSYVKLGWRDTGEAPKPMVARSEMERGIAKQRRIAADTVIELDVTAYFDTKQQAVDFEGWAFGELNGGSDWFDWTNPRTGVVTQARIVGGNIGRLTPDNKTWVYAKRSFKLEYIRLGFSVLAPGRYNYGAGRVLSVVQPAARSYVNGSGVLVFAAANQARFEGGQLVVEPAVTNLSTQSTVPTNAAWGTGATTKGAAVAAPDGTITAIPFMETATTAQHNSTGPAFSFVAGTRYVWSIYGREVAGSAKRYLTVNFPAAAFGVASSVTVDLATGAITTTAGTPFATGVSVAQINGFWRAWVCKVATITASAAPAFFFSNASGSSLPSYLGDIASGLVLWGRQLEVDTTGVGAPTSLIATAAAAVTVPADVVTVSV